MSLRLQMLQVARLAPNQLLDSADLVVEFLKSRWHEDGGFVDRAGSADLYYTVFGLDAMVALRRELPGESLSDFLRGFGDGAELDYVHLTCLGRCWSAIGADRVPAGVRAEVMRRIAAHRLEGGGYRGDRENPNNPHGSAYGCFLAVGASQDVNTGGQSGAGGVGGTGKVGGAGEEIDALDVEGIGRCLAGLACGDGSYSNDPNLKFGNVPATAAAVTLQHQLGLAIDPQSGKWLAGLCHSGGGFLAMPEAPIPDLLSTATALHALAAMQFPIDKLKDPCLDFIDSLWTARGGFYGNWMEEENDLDVEYTYYGLLALGHLSV